MKTLELSEASESLGEYARSLGKETIVVTSGRKPLAALIGLEGVDEESLALSTDPEFLRIIQAARSEVKRGKTVSLDTMRREVL